MFYNFKNKLLFTTDKIFNRCACDTV